MMISDGVELDVKRSTLHLADASLPVCGLLFPEHGDVTDTYERVLGGPMRLDGQWAYGWHWYVPCENGVLVEIGLGHWEEEPHARYTVSLDSRKIVRRRWGAEEDLVTADVYVGTDGSLCEYDRRRRRGPGTGIWYDCELDWIVEHVRRMVTKHVVTMPPTPDGEVKLLSAEETIRLYVTDEARR